MRYRTWFFNYSKRGLLALLCFLALALTSGTSTTAASPWIVGDTVVCIGSGSCLIYPAGFGTPTSISVLDNPKQATGGVAWTGEFDAWVVDSKNQKLLRFNKTTQAVVQEISTKDVLSSAHPGPIVLDSAGNIYVGMYDAPTILKYGSSGNHVDTISTSAGGPPNWMDLADDHKTMWFTTSGAPRQIQRIDVATHALLTAVQLTGAGTAGGFRLLPLVSPYDGSGGRVIADGLEIKGFGPGTAPMYDVTGEDAWRTVSFEADGTHFLAVTGAGKIYRFPTIGGVGVEVANTGSTQVSGFSQKGGVALNIRPLQFDTVGSNIQREAVYGNPNATANDPFPRHSIGVKVATVSSAFTLVTSANWVTTNGTCTGTVANDFDCRTATFFGLDPDPSPRCIPYVSANASDCAFYRYEDENITLPSGVTSADFLSFVDYKEPGKRTTSPYVHPACTSSATNGNPRMLHDPDPTGDQFETDITVGITRTNATDPIFGSGRGGSDYAAFDRCLAGTAGLATAAIAKPVADSRNRWGSSIPFQVFVVDANGADVQNAVEDGNNMSLYIRHSSGLTFGEPQETPGSSPFFFSETTIKMGKTTRIAYAANLETSQFLNAAGQRVTGDFVACVASVPFRDPNLPPPPSSEGPGQAGQFAPVCVKFTLF
jgi:hypothetical protein